LSPPPLRLRVPPVTLTGVAPFACEPDKVPPPIVKSAELARLLTLEFALYETLIPLNGIEPSSAPPGGEPSDHLVPSAQSPFTAASQLSGEATATPPPTVATKKISDNDRPSTRPKDKQIRLFMRSTSEGGSFQNSASQTASLEC